MLAIAVKKGSDKSTKYIIRLGVNSGRFSYFTPPSNIKTIPQNATTKLIASFSVTVSPSNG